MDRDEQLAQLLDQLAGQSQAGRMPDLEAVVREHPDLELELRELWATMVLAEDFASFSGELNNLTDGASPVQSGWEPSTAPIPGRIGDYEPVEEIGRGGMGVVYRARQTSLGRTVALKMILRGGLAAASDVARFRAEAESAARLNHANIVPVYEVGEHEGQPYFSMQLVEGTTLRERLQRGPLRAREAAELLVPICRAIHNAHQNGVLHRDLKPSNILIDKAGRAFVTDFGLAKRIPRSEGVDGDSLSLTTLTHSGAIVGTPSYMAPEQAAGQRGDISAATDVYSLGALLYAMLTGRAPFQAATPLDTVLMVLEQDPVPPRVLNPTADADLELIAMKCLQKPQDLRYDDAAAMADDLQAWLDGDPISARSSQFTQILSRALRETHHASLLENWGLLWMLHSLIVLVLCVVTNVMQWRDAESDNPS
ncbi:MAG: serine/threonine-protein kinase, partial [Planctomycetota bacterium]|nr:serine/threonine-protein kinase [Planctomycetota bacterium]